MPCHLRQLWRNRRWFGCFAGACQARFPRRSRAGLVELRCQLPKLACREFSTGAAPFHLGQGVMDTPGDFKRESLLHKVSPTTSVASTQNIASDKRRSCTQPRKRRVSLLPTCGGLRTGWCMSLLPCHLGLLARRRGPAFAPRRRRRQGLFHLLGPSLRGRLR